MRQTTQPPPKPEPAPSDDGLANLSQEIADHLRQNRATYEVLAQKGGFHLEFGDRACFDHTRSTIIIGVAQLARLNATDPDLIDFIVLHEIGHFLEYSQDPEGYLKMIQESQRRGDSEGQLYFELYNCLQDIYVNQNTADIAPQYRDGARFSETICSFYRTAAFAARDFSAMPRCQQYSNYLLNLGMGVADDITLSAEVKSVIDQGVSLFGQTMSYSDFIETYLIPALGHRSPKGWSGSMTQRRQLIEAAITPVFDALLAEDKKEALWLNPGISNPLADMDPDPAAIEAAAKAAQARAAERNRTPAERAALERGRQAGDIGIEAGLTPEQTAQFQASLERMQPVIQELTELISQLRAPVSSWRTVLEGPDARGEELSIDAAVENFSQIQRDPSSAAVFLRRAAEEHIEYLPRKVRLWVVADLSGSMEGNIADLKDMTVALAASMVSVSKQAELSPNGVTGELALIGYNNDATMLIEPSNGAPTLRSVAGAFPRLMASGGTVEHHALALVLERMERLQGAAESTPVLDILVGITDGETEEFEKSKDHLRDLRAKGIFAGAIYIDSVRNDSTEDRKGAEPSLSSTPQNTFDKIWNADGERNGRYISSTQHLPRAVRAIIERALTDFNSAPEIS